MSLFIFILIVLIGGVCILIGLQLKPLGGGPRDMRAAAAVLEDAMARTSDLVTAIRTLTRELEKTGADVSAQSAEHLRTLKVAMAEADKQIVALAPADGAPAPGESSAAPAPPPPPADPPARGRRVDQTVADEGAHPSDGQGRMVERYESVYRLADQGHTVEEIAQQMQSGKGEIDLILSLRHPR